MKHWKVALGIIPAFLAVSGVAHSQTIAFDVASGTIGHQAFGGSLGLDFNVVSTIQVSSLGFFDSGSDGIKGTNTAITVQLFDRNNTVAPVATQTFTSGSAGTLASGSGFSFKSISLLTLAAGGQYRIVASGFNASDPNGHTGSVGDPAATRNDGGGLISFPLSGGNYLGYYDNASLVYPNNQDPADSYLAGSFQFAKAVVVTPEPGAWGLLFGATVPGMLLYRRMRRK